MNSKFKEVLVVVILLIVQTVIYVVCGFNKSYIHMDEAYSLGLASYDKTEIQANDDFYDTWHTGKYYEDYLTVNDDEKDSYSGVYENQKNDVHPPFYYLILRFAMGFNLNNFSMWPGIIVNIVIYMFITIFMYLILQKLLQKETHVKEKAILLAFISSITMASLTSVLYIRMYALSTLNVLITAFLHIKLLENKKQEPKLLVLIGLSALVRCTYTLLLFILLGYAIYNICSKIYKTKAIQRIWLLYFNNGSCRNYIINNIPLFNTTYVLWI